MKDMLTDHTKMENPFLGEKGDNLWKRFETLPRTRITKEELLKRIQESKAKKLKG